MSKKTLSTVFELAAHSIGATNARPLNKLDYVSRKSFYPAKTVTSKDVWAAVSSYTTGQMKKDAALLAAVENNDLKAAIEAVESGANLSPKDSPYYRYQGEPLFVALIATGNERYDQETNLKLVKYLVDQGAPIGGDELYFMMDQSGYGKDNEAMQESIDRVCDLIVEASQKTFTADDYTDVLVDYQRSRAKPEVMERLVKLGGDPNSTENLVSFYERRTENKKRFGIFSRTATSYSSMLSARALPLHQWIKNLLDEERMVASKTMEAGHPRKVIDTLLDNGADPALLLDTEHNLYEKSEGYKRLIASDSVSHVPPVYFVSDEEKQALQNILTERKQANVNKPKAPEL